MDAELERLKAFPLDEKLSLIEQMDEAITTMNQHLETLDHDPRLAALTSRLDQVAAAARDNPEIIPTLAAQVGLTESEMQELLFPSVG